MLSGVILSHFCQPARSPLLCAGRLYRGEQGLLCSCGVLTGSSQHWLLSLQSTGLGTGSAVAWTAVCSPLHVGSAGTGDRTCVPSWRWTHITTPPGTPRPFIQTVILESSASRVLPSPGSALSASQSTAVCS